MKIVLFEPEIPPNTGSIARLTAGMEMELHLIEPLGFSLDNRYLKRAGLDYWPHVKLTVHKNWAAFIEQYKDHRLWFVSKKAKTVYTRVQYKEDDVLIFGRETKGLDPEIMETYKDRLIGIPIIGKIRSYNLSNAVSIVMFEALRQTQPDIF